MTTVWHSRSGVAVEPPNSTTVWGTREGTAFKSTTAGDTTAPTLTSPTFTATGSTTASGGVTTDEGNGTLYYYASTNSTETVATIKASGATQAVTGTGAQSVNFTGLTPSTAYYGHYVHRDAAGNDSTASNSASSTTSAPSVTTTTYSSDWLTGSYSFNVDAGTAPNRVVIALVEHESTLTNAIVSATYAGAAMSASTEVTHSLSSNGRARLFVLSGAASGSNSLAVTATGDHKPRVLVLVYSGYTAVSTGGENASFGGTPSVTLSSSSGHTAVALAAWDPSNRATAGTGCTEIFDANVGSSAGVSMYAEDKAGASSVTLGISTPGSLAWVIFGASLTPSSDTTAPTLTSPTFTATGSTTASGGVTTDEGNGTLYYYASTNSTETVATIKASGATQAVTGTGAQSVSFTGLTPSTTYYGHYVHRDSAGNDSTASNSSSSATSAAAPKKGLGIVVF